jgi:hypothetical protein
VVYLKRDTKPASEKLHTRKKLRVWLKARTFHFGITPFLRSKFNLKEEDNLEDLAVDGRHTLKCIIKKYGLDWLYVAQDRNQ